MNLEYDPVTDLYRGKPDGPIHVSFCDEYGGAQGKVHLVSEVGFEHTVQHYPARYWIACGAWSPREMVEVSGPVTCKKCLRQMEAE